MQAGVEVVRNLRSYPCASCKLASWPASVVDAGGRLETSGPETIEVLLLTAIPESRHLGTRFLQARGNRAPVLTGQWERAQTAVCTCAGLCCRGRTLAQGLRILYKRQNVCHPSPAEGDAITILSRCSLGKYPGKDPRLCWRDM